MNAENKNSEDRLIDETELLDDEVVLKTPENTDDDYEFLNRAGKYDWEVTSQDDDDTSGVFGCVDPEADLFNEESDVYNHRRKPGDWKQKGKKGKHTKLRHSPYDWDEEDNDLW